MDYQALDLTFKIGQFLLTGTVAVYVYVSNRDKVTNDRISTLENDLDGRLNDHAQRVARLEEASQHAVTHEDLDKIYNRIEGVKTSVSDLSRNVAALAGSFEQANSTLQRINDYLLTTK